MINEISYYVKNIGRGLLLLVMAFALLVTEPLPLCAEASIPREYKIKGAFLYNFIQFVDWPVSAFPSEHSPLIVGILGKNPFGSTLESLNGQKVKNRQLVIRNLSSVDEARECQLLFIGVSERGTLSQILTMLHGTPVLTVSDIDGFAANGGMIYLLSLEDKVRFEINLKEARAANLKLSSQLLKLARDVIQ